MDYRAAFLRDPLIRRFSGIPICDGQTYRQTDTRRQHIGLRR